MSRISLTVDQILSLIAAAQEGARPQETARQARNRRHYQARKRRKAEAEATVVLAATADAAHDAADLTRPAGMALTTAGEALPKELEVTPEAGFSSAHAPLISDAAQTLSDGFKTLSGALQTGSDTEPMEVGPSPSPPPSPPSPRPPSSAPTPTPPSAAAHAPAYERPPDHVHRFPSSAAAATAGGKNVGLDSASQQPWQDLTGLLARRAPRPKLVPLTDEAWLQELQQNAAYRHIPVREEAARMQAWFTARNLRCTRRALLAWLRRYQPPLALPAASLDRGTLSDSAPSLSGWAKLFAQKAE